MQQLINKQEIKPEKNKLLIVGHKTSNMQLIIDFMKKCVVVYARSLVKEEISPEDISKVILKHMMSQLYLSLLRN